VFGRYTTPALPDSVDEMQQLWDRLRADAVSQADREEIDAVFSRSMP
jgi:hypothetical protein